jgi:two-component system LytT family response regulator
MTEPRLRAVLVDDEAPARDLLREYLGAHADVEVVGECENGFVAAREIPRLAPDLVFLDVQMPKLDGFEVLELIAPGPAVVFCTAYDEFALKAFEVHAVDYLLKPFGRERLAEALARVRTRLGSQGPSPASLATAARAPGAHAERIVVRDGAEVHVIAVDDVDLLEAQDDYVAIHVGKKAWLKQQPLGDLLATLDPARFVRVHRSYAVPLDRIARVEPYGKDSRIAVLKNGREVPVSRDGYRRLCELME